MSSKSRLFTRLLVAYLAANVLLFFTNPYASRWHYDSHDPTPIEVIMPSDSSLSLEQIREILDSIDLAYGAREPSRGEKLLQSAGKFVQIAFLPSTVALVMKSFIGYMGPATPKQRAFTVSVKQRYNHLAKLAIDKGMKDDGFLFVEDASLSKENGQAFQSLRNGETGSTRK